MSIIVHRSHLESALASILVRIHTTREQAATAKPRLADKLKAEAMGLEMSLHFIEEVDDPYIKEAFAAAPELAKEELISIGFLPKPVFTNTGCEIGLLGDYNTPNRVVTLVFGPDNKITVTTDEVITTDDGEHDHTTAWWWSAPSRSEKKWVRIYSNIDNCPDVSHG